MGDRRAPLFTAALERGGLDEAMAFLNATVDLRYTAVYRLRGAVLECVGLHDKGGQVQRAQLEPATLDTSLCPFVIERGMILPRGDVTQYAVPVVGDKGELIGTLCHFDSVRHELPDEEFAFLTSAARAVARRLRQT
jgi:GAF domain-containing protein